MDVWYMSTVPGCWRAFFGKRTRRTSSTPWVTPPAISETIRCAEDFPHDIGIFLAYPLEDVIGFMKNHGGNYCCLGCWKAYGNAEAAERRFDLYRKCRRIYLSCYRRGFSLSRLTVAA